MTFCTETIRNICVQNVEKHTDSFNMDILDTAITRLLQTEYSMSMLAKDTCINIINIAIYIYIYREDTSDCTIILFVGTVTFVKRITSRRTTSFNCCINYFYFSI